MIPDDRDTDRLEFFSDAVIAIAATLLVIDIKVPRLEGAARADLWIALINQWPTYFAFVISFFFIGIGWVNHHGMFKYIKRTDHTLLLLNLVFLMFIVLVPFSASLLAEYIGKEGQMTAALIYHGVLAMASLSYNAVWWHSKNNFRLIDKTVDLRLSNSAIT